jgi:hypothetical protein
MVARKLGFRSDSLCRENNFLTYYILVMKGEEGHCHVENTFVMKVEEGIFQLKHFMKINEYILQ